MNLEHKQRETLKAGLFNGLMIQKDKLLGCIDEISYNTNPRDLSTDLRAGFVGRDEIHQRGGYSFPPMEVKAHLFPMEMLTKPIRVEGFNGGEEFVFVDLWEVDEDGCVMGVEFDHGNTKLIAHLKDIAKHNIYHDIDYLPSIVKETMRKAHFNTEGLPPEHYIDAHQSQVYSPK